MRWQGKVRSYLPLSILNCLLSNITGFRLIMIVMFFTGGE